MGVLSLPIPEVSVNACSVIIDPSDASTPTSGEALVLLYKGTGADWLLDLKKGGT